MQIRLLLLFLFFYLLFPVYAQESPKEIKYTVMDIQALRYYPFKIKADSIIRQITDRSGNGIAPCAQYDIYRKTCISLVANKESLDDQIAGKERKNDWIYKRIIKPYLPWLEYTRNDDRQNTMLTTALYEDYFTCYTDYTENKEGRLHQASFNRSLYDIFGEQNIASSLNDVTGDMDLFRKKNEILLHSIKSPLLESAFDSYRYFLAGEKTVDGETCYEIVFFPIKPKEDGLAGYFYVTTDGRNRLRKAVFTLNDIYNGSDFIKDALFVQRFGEKENATVPLEKTICLMLGDEIDGCFLLVGSEIYSDYVFPEKPDKNCLKTGHTKDYLNKDKIFWEAHRLKPLTEAEMQIDGLLETASHTRAYHNAELLAYLFLTNHLPIGGKNSIFEWGDVTKSISYNEIEGYQLKAGGNTTLNLSKHFLFGGYATYGLKSRKFNYRGDLIYSLPRKDKSIWEYPASRFSFSYVKDLTLLGYDVLDAVYDDMSFCIFPPNVHSLTEQKVGVLSYEKELRNRFSFKIEGKYLKEKSLGVIQYKYFTTSEVNLSFRYAPREKFFQSRSNRYCIQRGNMEINFKHSMGIKGIFGSEYNYHITEGYICKRFSLPGNAGKLYAELAGGKVWNSVPFPLLFIPTGNESLIFEKRGFNLMDNHEFVTDNYVSGNINFYFNWSPVHLFLPKNTIKTSVGSRLIYGPLSDTNNPALHPELFPFSEGINPLGQQPYIETNIGLSNIFQILRIEYVRRLTYLSSENKANKGALRVSLELIF